MRVRQVASELCTTEDWMLPQANHARVCELILFDYKSYINGSYVNIKIVYCRICGQIVIPTLFRSLQSSSSLMLSRLEFTECCRFPYFWNNNAVAILAQKSQIGKPHFQVTRQAQVRKEQKIHRLCRHVLKVQSQVMEVVLSVVAKSMWCWWKLLNHLALYV